MNLQFVLGIVYFTVIVALVAASVWLIGRPIAELIYDVPVLETHAALYYTQAWAMPFVVIAGALLLTVTMHLVKVLGQWHGALAKAMLVQE